MSDVPELPLRASREFQMDLQALPDALQNQVLSVLPFIRVPAQSGGADEGAFSDRSNRFNWYYRRAITPDQRRQLDMDEAAGIDRDSDDPHEDPWNWLILYRALTGDERIRHRIVHGGWLQNVVPIDRLPFDPHNL